MLSSFWGQDHKTNALTIVRVVVSLLLVVHGVARLSLGIVDDFGGFLSMVGFPAGSAIAWTITIVEIVGGLLLAVDLLRLPLSIYFAFQLLIGIILVHGSEGWFVVGAGRNGVEYSVLLIACLAAIAYTAKSDERRIESNSG